MPYQKGDQDELTDLQELVAAKLRARASVLAAGIPILTQWGGNLTQQAELEENKARCIVLFPPAPVTREANAPGPYFDEITLTFQVITQPELLDAGEKGALYWAMEILREFHLKKLDDPDYSCAFYAKPGVENPASGDHPRKNMFEVYIITHFGLTQA